MSDSDMCHFWVEAFNSQRAIYYFPSTCLSHRGRLYQEEALGCLAESSQPWGGRKATLSENLIIIFLSH